MSFSTCKKYRKKSFDVGELKKATLKIQLLLDGGYQKRIFVSYRFENGVSHEKEITDNDLDLITCIEEPISDISICYNVNYRMVLLILLVREFGSDNFQINVRSESIEQCSAVQEILESELGITEIKEKGFNVEDGFVSQRKEKNGLFLSQDKPLLLNEKNINKNGLKYPEKATMKWLFHNVPLSTWIWFFGLLTFAFGSGVAITETDLYESLKSREEIRGTQGK